MKSKLLTGVAIPALLALGTLAAAAQDVPPPSQTAPAEKFSTDPVAPAPSPAVKPDLPAAPLTKPEDLTAAPPASSDGYASAQSSDEWRSSKLIGTNVYNSAGDNIGDINDLIVDADGAINAAVIGVGGFLGMGEKLVAVPFKDLKFTRDENGNQRVMLDSTKEALENAPDFKFYNEKRI